jgi:phosphoenolpyruvate carboxykinase (GTP)
MWPGYGDNSRVLAWIFDRCNGVDNAVETPIGYMPKEGAINTDGLADYYKETLPQITKVDVEGWKKELADVKENHYPKFGKHLPKELSEIIDMIQDRLNKAELVSLRNLKIPATINGGGDFYFASDR